MKGDGATKINGYVVHIYRNEDNDIVLKQPDPYEDDAIIVIGKEQLDAVIKALSELPNLEENI
jgi:hypothetical protein